MTPLSRRAFLAAAAAPALAAPSSQPWHQRVRRVGQVNFNEKDPAEIDVEAWADYWASCRVDAVQLSITGIIAFYPTDVPFHRRSRWLGGRDLFGECVRAARQRGIRVIGRLSPDLQWEDALAAHPEWFVRDREGRPVPPFSRTPGLYQTCMFSSYFTEQIPAILREVNARYEVDAFYANGWPNWNLPECDCEACRRLPPRGTPEFRDRFMERVIEIWTLYDRIAKEKSQDSLFFGNLGGGFRTGVDLYRLAPHCFWFNADNQGRTSPAPVWGAAQQGRVAWCVMKGRTVTNVTGAWSTGSPVWRNAAKSPAEAEIWMAQTAASGMAVWYHWLGAQTGLGEDRRWQEYGRRFLQWHARHNRHFLNRRPLANVALLLPQRTQTFYANPGEGDAGEHVQGWYAALLEGRHAFAFVHEDDLSPETLAPFDLLILPNAAWLSDEQARRIEAFAARGGSVIADFETGLYDGRGRPRADFALARLFGIRKAGERTGVRGFYNSFYARIEQPGHELLRGVADTRWLAGAEWRVPVRTEGPLLLSVVPPYPAYPTETVFPERPRTDEAAVAVREEGGSRCVYFAGDAGRTFWRSFHPDPLRLMLNAIEWALRGRRPVRVEGEGLLELFAWETEAGFALHLLNYNNPNAHRGVYLRHSPVGPQQARFELPREARIRRVTALRAGRPLRFAQKGRVVEFRVPAVADYEVAALE
ncbi:MAG: beta-galactosidase trimerization domain-containing protein [Bryobacteraceae bacterium]|nr:beta-galactosidase trimerization domain-containing protein [Bryobacteraceae bacterium]